MFAASFAVTVTVVVPTGNVLPEAGLVVMVTAPPQLSVAVGANVTALPQVPVVDVVVILEGQVITGACVSFTVTVKVQVDVLPWASVAVAVTVVVPTGKNDPLVGDVVTVTPGQLSVAVIVGKVTTAPHWFASFDLVILAGQVITGACVSFTVTVNEQPPPVVEVTFTVVVPTGKNDPEAGVAVTVPHPPEVVGAA